LCHPPALRSWRATFQPDRHEHHRADYGPSPFSRRHSIHAQRRPPIANRLAGPSGSITAGGSPYLDLHFFFALSASFRGYLVPPVVADSSSFNGFSTGSLAPVRSPNHAASTHQSRPPIP